MKLAGISQVRLAGSKVIAGGDGRSRSSRARGLASDPALALQRTPVEDALLL
jgi:hypothetical protein